MCVRIEAVFGAVQFSVAWYRYRSMLPHSVIPVQLTPRNGAFLSNVMVFLIVRTLPSFRVCVWDDKWRNVKQKWYDDLRGMGGLSVLGRKHLPLPLCPLRMTRGDLRSNQGLRGERLTRTCLSYGTYCSLNIKPFASAEKSNYDVKRYHNKWQ